MFINVTDDENLNKFNSTCDKGNWFVWYFADWCGHCTEMNPEWENLKSNNVNNVKLAKVRDDFISKLKPEAPVQGYPTIILYKDGQLSNIYSGERNESAFNNFLSSNTDSSANNNNTNNTNNSSINNNDYKSVKSKITETDSGIEIDLNTILNNTKSKKKSRKKRKTKVKKAKPKSPKRKAKPKPKSPKRKTKPKPKSPKRKAKPKSKAKSPKRKAKSPNN